MIDVTKPLELADGRPVTFNRFDHDGDIVVTIAGAGTGRVFRPDGVHWLEELPNLRNVAEPVAPAEPFEFIDVSVEVSRTYTFPTGTVTIDKPEKLHVSPSHSHRLIDADGRSHYVPAGWLHLSWTVKPGAPHFVA
ncbi:hypothetical protein [Sphingobium sp. CCH11-B1]|uniref:hypothetical protein n=1 Tax=Sphingobium sp. CCH11-B1 TaxID=1768781 RepID=UPI000830AE27|nr:hypothetical protein [Sphingobium sp. CCH11-B1]